MVLVTWDQMTPTMMVIAALEVREVVLTVVVMGAKILAKVNSSEWPEDRLMAAMDTYLERDHDRALFGLPPRQKDEPG